MLRQQTQPEATTTSPIPVAAPVAGPPEAATERVTPQEFADALAAIERQRTGKASRDAETIAIGDALTQLNVELSPEEVAAEIRSTREKRRKATDARRARTIALIPAITAVVLLLSISSVFVLHNVRRDAVTAAPPAIMVNAPAIATINPDSLLVTDASGKTPVVKTLGEVKDGVPVTIGAAALKDLLVGLNGTGFELEDYADKTPWTIIKYNGKPYLRGFTALRATNAALKAGPIALYSRSDPMLGMEHELPAKPVRMTLPLEGMQVTHTLGTTEVSGNGYQQFTLHVEKVDSHAFEP